MSTIFVQIAAYNDDELFKTVNDCIEKSSKQNEIHFGIHECYVNKKTEFNLQNVKIIYSKAPENLGVGVGRYIANKLYNNEDYYLQIDCHTRFRENWDTLIINNINKYLEVDNKCILTGYPPGYWYEEDGSETLDLSAPTTLIKLKRDNDLMFKEKRTISQEGIDLDDTFCSESISAGFIFGKGDIYNVKQHPGIFYFGEELLRAVAFYTKGYNFMAPDIPVVFHLYGSNSTRVPCWMDYPEESADLEKMSSYIIKTLLSEHENNATSKVWLGQERSLSMYGTYIHADFKRGIIYKEEK